VRDLKSYFPRSSHGWHLLPIFFVSHNFVWSGVFMPSIW
jgi:hypothetical protein